MKRINNKFRNNNGNNNQIYSLNYKFDSTSPAGKCSGTALDLIKRYNELAKDAAGDNDYVSAEVFRQYAEHYRKIVTDINEKKTQNRPTYRNAQTENEAEISAEPSTNATEVNEEVSQENATSQRSFTIVEVPHTEAESAIEQQTAEEPIRKKRVYRRHQAVAE